MRITMLGSGSVKSSLSFRLIQLARELSRSGHEATAILPSADKYNHFTADPKARIPGVKLCQPWQFRTHAPILNLLPYLVSGTWNLFRSRPDMVYLYKPTPITIIGLLPKLFSRTPAILDLDDLGSEVMRRQGQSSLMVRLVAWCERLALRYADAVVVTSTFLEATVLERYPDKPVLVLPNGVDVARYDETKEQAPRPHIYYFGTVDNLDLVEYLLRAAPVVIKEIPQARFTVIGGGKALPQAKQLARALGVSRNVTFTGWTDMFTAQKYTQFADLAVCYQPDSRATRAASNMKVFQYMAMGSVPVVSNVGDLRSYIQDGKAGAAVQPGDPQALAQTLAQLLENQTHRTRLARNARRLAETDYAWQTLGAQLELFIRPIGQEAVHA